ncbi:MAG: hypothetical protein IPI66_03020 [Chitinophagaceae bacterium]|nr:hypothetical protein [Chitinophagaceae bacterium]MBL0055154.1 hypothetical protein [Chitinophagaceae bacterium]
MKKIFTYAFVTALAAVLIASCTKEKVYDDNSYWLSQEQGRVVYSSNSCGYYVVETNYGYTIIRNLDGLRVYEEDLMYGNFGAYGNRNFYNYTANIITNGTVVEYDLSYIQAQDAIDYYCPYGKANGSKIKESSTSQSKMSRPATLMNK